MSAITATRSRAVASDRTSTVSQRIGVDGCHERGLPAVVDVASFAVQLGAHRCQEVGTNEPSMHVLRRSEK